MRALTVVKRPCGFGKTRAAAEMAAEAVKAGVAVLYVAPTFALLEQFHQVFLAPLLPTGTPVVYAVGRRPGFNCQVEYISLAARPMFFCQNMCPHSASCNYLQTRLHFERNTLIPGAVYLTTYSFLLYSGLGTRGVLDALVIYDEMPPYPVFFRSTSAYRDGLRGLARHLPLRKTALWRDIARHYEERRIPDPPVGAGLIRLPLGNETYLLSATPSVPVLQAMLPPGTEIRVDDAGPALDQDVRLYYTLLTHSGDWLPSPWGAGFKRNTRKGLPYFNASIGLGDWRGMKLEAFGSFMPPPYVFGVLAALMGAKVEMAEVDIRSDAKFKHPLSGVEERTLKDGVLCFRIGDELHPVPLEFVASALVQLLGRSGMGVENAYFGSIPIRARNHRFFVDYARRVVIAGVDPLSAALAAIRHFVASGKRGLIGWMVSFYPHAFSVLSESAIRRIASEYRRRVERMNDRVEQAAMHVRTQMEQQEENDGREIEEDLPF